MLTDYQHQLFAYGLLVVRDSFLSLYTRIWRRGVCKHIPREVALRCFPILNCPVASAKRQPGLLASPPSSQVSRKPWNPHTHL
jgi:hypothetical protein